MSHLESLKGGEICGELVGPLIVCMQDKTASVRAVAEQLLTALMARAAVSKGGLCLLY
jgi:hypothetical protein